jgi:hypothetical protein
MAKFTMKDGARVTYKVERRLAVLDKTKTQALEVRRVAWNGRPARVEIRWWWRTQDGEERPREGVRFPPEAWARLLAFAAEKSKGRREG